MMAKPNRRNMLLAAASACTAGVAVNGLTGGAQSGSLADRRTAKSPVFVTKAADYSVELAQKIAEGVKACGLDVKGKRILLKPNLVEFSRQTVINTDVSVVAAALEVFSSLGAAEVRIGEGPGHRRDPYALAEQTAYRGLISRFDDRFVDLNRDDVTYVAGFAGEPGIYLPNSALGADLIVSIPKMKTHHWAGATLSMKNYFGLVPGAVYGWPKNTLHMLGIARSIVELNRIFAHSFAIVDGIVGMEGNGPIQGTPRHAGVLVMGGDLRAVDSTCCRIMGLDPARLRYLDESAHLGNATEAGIEQRGEAIAAVRTPFALIPEFAGLRLPA